MPVVHPVFLVVRRGLPHADAKLDIDATVDSDSNREFYATAQSDRETDGVVGRRHRFG